MSEVILSKRNRIVLPQEAREALGVEPGDKIAVDFAGRILVLQAARRTDATVRGLVPCPSSATHLRKGRRS